MNVNLDKPNGYPDWTLPPEQESNYKYSIDTGTGTVVGVTIGSDKFIYGEAAKQLVTHVLDTFSEADLLKFLESNFNIWKTTGEFDLRVLPIMASVIVGVLAPQPLPRKNNGEEKNK